MTRVLHVLDHSLPLHSGYTFRTRAILKAQQAAGLEVRGITGLRQSLEGPNPEEVDGLIFHRTPGQAGGPPGLREWREIARLAHAIERLCAQWRPDILHAHSPALCGEAALLASRRLRLPLVYEIRAFWEDAAVGNGGQREGSPRYRLTRALENHVVRKADAVVTICDGLRRDLIARGTDPARVTIMPNGVDLAMFGIPAARDPALAAELGLGCGPVIGFIGSFYDYEGIDDLIAAMPALVARHPEARLLLVGGGPREDALKRQAEQSTVAAAIRFVGRVPHDQVERYYALADIMAYPRKKSRLTDLVTPLKPLEAMAQGKLVAASDVGGHRELMTDGVTGTLFAADDPAACADALAGLLDRRNEWDGRRAAGRHHVETRHDWARNVMRYQDVYQRLIGPGVRNTPHAAAPISHGPATGRATNEVRELAEPARTPSRGTPPISRHPLFPAIAALWGAAIFLLLGLAAGASMGSGVRIRLALAMAVIGGAIGALVARRIARPMADRQQRDRASADTAMTDTDAGEGLERLEGSTPAPSALDRKDDAHETPADPAIFRTAPAMDEETGHTGAKQHALPQEHTRPILNVAEFGLDRLWDPEPDATANEPVSEARQATAAERIAAADLDDLSHLQLLERLAISMNRRREMAAETAAALPQAAEPDAFEDAPENAGAAPDTDHGDETADPHEDDPASERAYGENAYGSLLTVAPSSASASPLAVTKDHETVRAAMKPVGPSGSRDPDETEKALRTALAALQRISGAA